MTNANRLSTWRQRWAALSARERGLVTGATVLVALALVGSLVMAPAWRAWRDGPTRLAEAQARWERVQGLAAEASGLQGAGAPTAETAGRDQAAGLDDATRAALVRALGSGAKVQTQAGEITADFPSASAEGVRDALRTARQRLAVRLVEVDLSAGAESGLQGRLRWEWTPR